MKHQTNRITPSSRSILSSHSVSQRGTVVAILAGFPLAGLLGGGGLGAQMTLIPATYSHPIPPKKRRMSSR
jgi:hypothetical protein